MATVPRRIEWAGPSGIVVILDEDGINLHFGSIRAIEHREVMALLALIAEVQQVIESGTAPLPTPPTREEIRNESAAYRARRVANLVSDAILNELDPTREGVPF